MDVVSTIIPLHHQTVRSDGDGPPLQVPSRRDAPLEGEVELLRRLRAGDRDALTAISHWMWDSLAAYAFRLLEDRDAACDVAQEALLRLWESRNSPLRSLRPFLYRVTRNLAFDQLRARRKRGLLLQTIPPVARQPVRPDELLEEDRRAHVVNTAIQALPRRRREVFVLAYLRGLTYAEIAEIMKISPKTVQHQMSAALMELRRSLRPLIEQDGVNGT